VLGNNDHQLAGILPETDQVMFAGVPIALIHDAGPRAGRDGRMARRFPASRVVVYGHSHIPDDHTGLDGQLLFNPGSPTDRRGQPRHTYGVLEVDEGRVVDHRVVGVGA
jgi:predicted phosphodiesterase